MREEGRTFEEIGKDIGVTRQRAHQIYEKFKI
jgi:DNA-directed RNA polymerase sigma subunit (sigma70/sigma32)